MTNQGSKAEDHAEKGLRFARKGKLKRAIAEFRQALLLSPHQTTVSYNLALALHKRGDYEETIHLCEQLLRIEPDADAYGVLGNAKRACGRWQEAVAAYRNALQIQPDHVLILYNLGLALTEGGQFAEAETVFRKALRLSPNDQDASDGLSCALQRQGRLSG